MSSLQKSRKYIPYRSKPIDSTRFINFLFPESCKNHKEGIVKQYFNHFYDMGEFIEMIESLMRDYEGFSDDGCFGYYSFPDTTYQFDDGLIRFSLGLDDDLGIYITERQFFDYAKEACLRFIRLHPEHRDFVMNIVDNWKPKYPDKYPE